MSEKENITDPNLPIIEVTDGGGRGSVQDRFIADLVTLLHQAGYEDLNYDHVRITVPKSDVPLEHEEGRCDISVGLKDDVFAQIEVEVRKCV